jgi:hypothetical protein
VIFLGGMDAVGGPMLKQMKELGITASSPPVTAVARPS